MSQYPDPIKKGSNHPRYSTALAQVKEMQEILFKCTKRENIKDSDLAQVCRAWDVLEDRRRILRNKPLPKAADADKINCSKSSKSKKSAPTLFEEGVSASKKSDSVVENPKESSGNT